MDYQPNVVWTPTDHDLSNAQITSLASALGQKDFDSLYSWSVDYPDAYWEGVMQWLGIRWQVPYASYVDVSEGKAFPRWFPGGKLNWVDSVFASLNDHLRSDRLAVIAEDESGRLATRSYAQLHDDVRAFAAGLLAADLSAGDRIGLLMESSLEAVVSFLAISWIGAVAVPLFSGFGSDAIVARLAGCEAKALICTTGYARRGNSVRTRVTIEESVAALDSLRVVIAKPTGDPPHESIAGALDWYDVLAVGRNNTLENPLPVGANTPFMIVYTSGTTGKPKGTVHTHGGFPLKIAHDAAVFFNLGPGDTWLWPADMGWVAGPITIAGALLRGAVLVCYDGAPNWPDWSRLPQMIRRHGVSHFGASPTLIRSLAANESSIAPDDLTSIRLAITAGEVIDTETFRWYCRTFGCPVINFTGGSEVSGGLLANVVVKPIEPGGFNAVAPSIRVDVRGGGGQPVRGEIGELAVVEPFVGMTRAFWRDPERYLDTYWRSVPDIWIHGDLAIQHGDHAFFLCGRSDDTLKIAGKRVGPAEIEDLIVGMAEVAEAAAVGIADARKGERLVVFVLRDTSSGNERSDLELAERIKETVARKLGRAFLPSEVHAVDELPRTRSGKVMRRLIKRAYERRPLGDTASLENPAAIEVIRAAADGRSDQSDQVATQ
jgi:acetyl-CoA synthetase